MFVGLVGVVEVVFDVFKKFVVVLVGVDELVWLVTGGVFAGEAVGAVGAFEADDLVGGGELYVGGEEGDGLVAGDAN